MIHVTRRPLAHMRVGARTRDITTNITRTETAEAISYAMVIDGETVSHLDVDPGARWILHVETMPAHQGCGYARQLWDAVNAEAECFQALDHHRTAEGDAFAQAVGGDLYQGTGGERAKHHRPAPQRRRSTKKKRQTY
jgi:hypothetical protein